MRDALKIPSQEYVVEEKPKILQKLKHFLFGVLFGVGVSVVFLSLSALLMSVSGNTLIRYVTAVITAMYI